LVNCNKFEVRSYTISNKKLISRWDRRTLRRNSSYRLNRAVVVKRYHSIPNPNPLSKTWGCKVFR